MVQNLKNKLDKAVDAFNQELRSLRLGRANPTMVEGLMIDVYGTSTPLNQVASITTPQPNQILIQPWDSSNLESVQSAIQKSDLQLNPVAEGNSIRLTLPPLTEETRKQAVKEAAKHAEEARISVRTIREDTMRDVDVAHKNKDISEDEKFRQEKQIQEAVDEYNKKIQEALDRKESEILGSANASK